MMNINTGHGKTPCPFCMNLTFCFVALEKEALGSVYSSEEGMA